MTSTKREREIGDTSHLTPISRSSPGATSTGLSSHTYINYINIPHATHTGHIQVQSVFLDRGIYYNGSTGKSLFILKFWCFLVRITAFIKKIQVECCQTIGFITMGLLGASSNAIHEFCSQLLYCKILIMLSGVYITFL